MARKARNKYYQRHVSPGWNQLLNSRERLPGFEGRTMSQFQACLLPAESSPSWINPAFRQESNLGRHANESSRSPMQPLNSLSYPHTVICTQVPRACLIKPCCATINVCYLSTAAISTQHLLRASDGHCCTTSHVLVYANSVTPHSSNTLL